MSLSQWTSFKTGSPSIGIVTAITHPSSLSPILSTGSLRVQQYSVTESLVNIYRNTYTPGLIKGRYRSVFRCIEALGTTNYSAGFTVMQSQLNLSGGSGGCYFAHLTVQTGGTSAKFIIRKFTTTGLQTDLSAPTTLYTGSSLGTVLGQDIAFELEWDASSGTSCIFTIKHNIGSTSFSGMTTETTTTDTTSPIVTSAGEGLGFTNGTSSGQTDWLVDITSLVNLL